MFLTGALENLPNVVLAAIVLVAVKGLVNIGEMKRLWRVSRYEFAVSMIAFGAVLLLGILNGVIVAVIASLLLLIRRVAQPHVATLGRIPGTRKFSDIERNPDNTPVPGALVIRVDAALLYFNVDHVREVVRQNLRAAPGLLKLVVCDLSTSAHVDLAGARMLVKAASGTCRSGNPVATGRRACPGARHPARRRTRRERGLLRAQNLGGRRHRRVRA